jgi:hypothetical protein
MGLDSTTYWLTDHQSQCDFDFDFTLQNKVLCTIGNFPRCTPDRDMCIAFSLPFVYDYITKLCRTQAEVIRSHENEHVRDIGQGEARHRKYKRLKLGGGQAYARSSD